MAELNEIENSPFPHFFAWILNISGRMWRRVSKYTQRVLKDHHVYEHIDELGVYMAKHPVIALVVFAVVISCGIPVLLFLIFAVVTILLTFTGFVIVEGTLLTIASVVLCVFLLSTLMVILTLSATMGVAYFGFLKVFGLRNSTPETSPLAGFISAKVQSNSRKCVHSRAPSTTFQNED
uniref:Promethin n=1 Tax=Timema tahoe TaxID=61484 RepID=A0A7R9NY50_9NEOP|nr:unnamed protein product [Timema tahoe]